MKARINSLDRILITGVAGFVGHHFLQYLYENNIQMEVYGVDVNIPSYDCDRYQEKMKISFATLNLLNIEELRGVFRKFVPDYILHLASFSSVAYSWQHPADSFVNNTNLFLNLLTVAGEFNKNCRILSIGSSEEYGNVSENEIPITEDTLLKPVSPYAVARVSQEELSRLYVNGYGFDIVMTRSFNHIGPWQDTRFAVPSFIKQIANIKESGQNEGKMQTGDISVIRDFTDVRDVVRAYYFLLKNGKKGEIYNVCSGRGIALRDIVVKTADILKVKIQISVCENLLRPNENRVIIGNNTKLHRESGWSPEIEIEKTIRDMLENTEGLHTV